jgi:peptidoglycan-N-acetylglucosamine deacetylase
MYLHRTPAILPWIYPGLYWRMPAQEKKVYLTFDDGPIPEITPRILDILDQHEVKATFFCVGDNVRKYPEVFTEVVQRGHQVGNHTYHHVVGWKMRRKKYYHDIRLADAIMQPHLPSGQTINLFRPPHGKISRLQILGLKPEYKIVMWDVLSGDFDTRLTPEDCYYNTLKATRPGSIVVFHDSLKASSRVLFVLPRYIDQLREQGYTFGQL